MRRILPAAVAAVSLLASAGCGRDGTVRDPAPHARGDSAVTRLLLDFEHGLGGAWDNPGGRFSRYSLEISRTGETRFNASTGSLLAAVRPGLDQGFAQYDLAANGLDPIPITPRTVFAWSWRPAVGDETNGFWIILFSRNMRTGTDSLQIRATSWRHADFDVLGVYFDPPNRWAFHSETVFEYLTRRVPPFEVGDFVIESIGLGFSKSPGGSAAIDNIWIGEGDPPPGVDTIVRDDSRIPPRRSELRGLSYGFLDPGWRPDRVEVYHGSMKVQVDPPAGQGRRFTDRDPDYTVSFGMDRGWGAASIIDIDADGRGDCLLHFDDFLGNVLLANRLARGRFDDRTSRCGGLRYAGEGFYAAAASDVDGDGDIDILLCNPHIRKNAFGGVRFLAREGAGYADRTNDCGILSQAAFGASFGDIDGDGDQDLFVAYRAYDKPDSVRRRPHLYVGDGNGRFAPAPERLDLPDDIHIRGGFFLDVDNDADLDLYVVARKQRFLTPQPPWRNYLFINDGNGRFTDETEARGLALARYSMAAVAADFDLDGWIDIYELCDSTACILHRNTGGGFFRPDSAFGEFEFRGEAIGGAVADIDVDGDLDLAILMRDSDEPRYIVNADTSRSFLQVRLRGTGKNTAGIGGEVLVYDAGHLGDPAHLAGFRQIQPGGGFGSYSPPAAHFGLGGRRAVDLLVRFPPAGGRPGFEAVRLNVPAGSRLRIVETGNPIVALWHGLAAERLRWEIERRFFRIPIWIAALPAFSAAAAAGLYMRGRIAPFPSLVKDTLLIIGTVLLILAAAVRAPLAAASSVALAALAISRRDGIEALFRRVVMTGEQREKYRDLVHAQISHILHTDNEFGFMRDYLTCKRELLRDRKGSLRAEFSAPGHVVGMMRSCDPGGVLWRRARTELRRLVRAARDMRGAAKEPGALHSPGGDRRDAYRRSLASFQETLRRFRADLRRRDAIGFAESWRALRSEYDPKLAGAGISLAEDFAPEIERLRVYLHPIEFRQIFGNLFDNSIRALEQSPRREIRLEASTNAVSLRLRWLDTGIGIPGELIERLFTAPVAPRLRGGHGTGCRLAGEIVRKRKGTIRAEPPPDGHGALVCIELPKIEEETDQHGR